MRGFERVRLINAEPYVAVAKPLDTPVEADEADEAD
jgi:hypothetical protein